MASANDNQLEDLSPTQQLVEENRANGWKDLDPRDRGVAAAFVTCNYSYKEAAEYLGTTPGEVKKSLRNPLVAAYMGELQKDDFTGQMVTKQFITASLLNLIPKLAGEEEVPFVDKYGTQHHGFKFFPGELRATIETLARTTDFEPEKGSKGGAGGVNVQINFGDILSGDQPEINVTPAEEDNG